jgi:hypothetical protein
MYGDWSRIRFTPKNQFVAVVKQQGRVDVDADDLEQHAIDLAVRRGINADLIGAYGGPEDNLGFGVTVTTSPNGDKITIGHGRYYINGLEIENPVDVDYDQQPWLVGAPGASASLLAQLRAAAAGSTIGFVLEAWVRLATALDDPLMLEPALGGADTTVRLQTVWRVVGTVITSQPRILIHYDSSNPISKLSPSCQWLYSGNSNPSTGQLTASVAQSGPDCGCQPIAAAGYQGLENQLYRVEIHEGGDLTSATFKWSRENGSVVTAITAVNGAVLTVASLGKDANLGFAAGQWVELSDDSFLFGPTPNQPGVLCHIFGIDYTAMQVTLTAPITFNIDPTKNARMRRWDQSGATISASGVPVSATPVALENGIQVSFSAGTYNAGDYWAIPARTASGTIIWPPDGSANQAQSPAFTKIFFAPVASVSTLRFGDRFTVLTEVSDCRLKFPSLNTLNATTTPPALHVTAISWVNDDVMTVDTLLTNGLSVTFDAAPTSPFGGGNFRVTLEPSMLADVGGSYATMVQRFSASGQTNNYTDVFLRTVFALDPPQGIAVTNNQVIWLAALTRTNLASADTLWLVLNTALSVTNPSGFARVRVRLDGGAVYGAGASGNIYLDGQTFGTNATRASDGAARVDLTLPSGESAEVSDFESWFYLAPSLLIKAITIVGTVQGAVVALTAVTLEINPQGVVQQIYEGTTAQGSTVTNFGASLTFNYATLAATTVSLTLSGTPAPGAQTIATVPATVTAAAGAVVAKAPITLQGNPPTATGTTPYQMTVNAAVATAVRSIGISAAFTVYVVVVTPPPRLE